MKNKIGTFLIVISSLLISGNVLATALQQFNVVNLLSNQDATAGMVGQSPASVLTSFYTSGASTACYQATIAYQGSITINTGTGNPCTTAVTSIHFAPIASTTIGSLYTAPSNFTPTSGQFYTQVSIKQQAATTSGGVTTSYGPVFDTTNGIVATPGTVSISAQ